MKKAVIVCVASMLLLSVISGATNTVMIITPTSNDDISSNDPELDAGDDREDPANKWDGELAQNMVVTIWLDDGDNILEGGEDIIYSPAELVE